MPLCGSLSPAAQDWLQKAVGLCRCPGAWQREPVSGRKANSSADAGALG